MRITSTQLQRIPMPDGAEPQKPLIDRMPLSEASVEIPEVLLSLSGLQDTHSILGNGLRLGIGSLALVRAAQTFRSDESKTGRLSGLSSLALAVAAGASVLPGSTAAILSRSSEGVHGLCEMALGAHEVYSELSENRPVFSPEMAYGILGFTKGATTFLPGFMPATSTFVAVLHLGILVTKSALEHSANQEAQKLSGA